MAGTVTATVTEVMHPPGRNTALARNARNSKTETSSCRCANHRPHVTHLPPLPLSPHPRSVASDAVRHCTVPSPSGHHHGRCRGLVPPGLRLLREMRQWQIYWSQTYTRLHPPDDFTSDQPRRSARHFHYPAFFRLARLACWGPPRAAARRCHGGDVRLDGQMMGRSGETTAAVQSRFGLYLAFQRGYRRMILRWVFWLAHMVHFPKRLAFRRSIGCRHLESAHATGTWIVPAPALYRSIT